MCQRDWAKGCSDSGENIMSGCTYVGVSGRDEHLKCYAEYRRASLPMQGGINKSIEGLSKTQSGGGGICSLLELRHRFSLPGHQRSWIAGLWV